jgi:hypothetical protein
MQMPACVRANVEPSEMRYWMPATKVSLLDIFEIGIQAAPNRNRSRLPNTPVASTPGESVAPPMPSGSTVKRLLSPWGAHVRHVHTEYDRLLNSGWERHEARARVLPKVEQVLEQWSE